ncbi:MAG: antitoxin [Acidimicrobiales bacterium]|nr:MAG: antitoxin [Acidimicrobiales bacterium]
MLSHRLQILLDDDRYARVTTLAQGRDTSVAAVIREAIDRGLPATTARRYAAGERILTAAPEQFGDAAELKTELDELRGRHG